MATIVTRSGKGSALTWQEGDDNFTNLNNDKIEAVVDDTTPQLGGNLDVNGHNIVSTANADVTIAPNGTGIVVAQSDLQVGYGNQTAAITSNGAYNLDLVTNDGTNSGLIRITAGANQNIQLEPNGTGKVDISGLLYPNTDGTNGQVLTTNGAGQLSFTTVSGGITDLVQDTTPQLGGNLDVNGQQIVSVSNGNIVLAPNGTGIVRADKSVQIQAQGEIRLADSDSSNYVGFKSPATVSSNLIWTLPSTDGTSGQVLSTNGTGTLSWATAGGGGASLQVVAFEFSSPAVRSGSTYQCAVTEKVDTGNIASVASTYNFSLPSGTYTMFWATHSLDANYSDLINTSFAFTSNSGDATVSSIGFYRFGKTSAAEDTYIWCSSVQLLTLTQTTSYSLTFTDGGTPARLNVFPRHLTLIKVS